MNDSITQWVEIRPDKERFHRLLEILGEWYDKGKLLIFVDKQESCDNLFRCGRACGGCVLVLVLTVRACANPGPLHRFRYHRHPLGGHSLTAVTKFKHLVVRCPCCNYACVL